MLTERLLQFLWQFQYFNKNELTTANNERLQIIFPGSLNKNQGPDFSEAKIKIDDTILVGNIELHVLASDWYTHEHDSDENYAGIILHVVWEVDKIILDDNGKAFPTLEIRSRISKLLLEKYYALMHSQTYIPCEKIFQPLSNLVILNLKERLNVERLQRKSEEILGLLKKSKNAWEDVLWLLTAHNFGNFVNGDNFQAMSHSISLNIIAKHKNQIHQLEALMFGQACLLEGDFKEDYPAMLQREYRFLAKKYSLVPIKTAPLFLRMRPSNFPTVRIAQLAMLVQNSSHLFSKIKETEHLTEIKKVFEITANDYWNYHYVFDEETPLRPKRIGSHMIDLIIINTVVPILFTYGLYTQDQKYKDKALRFLNEISSEQNTVTKKMMLMGIENKRAFDSQALLELKKYYCDKRRCLECAIGNKLLRG